MLLLFKFNQQVILSVACTYTEIINNLFFRFFRNLCNILHECDSSATPEKQGKMKGGGGGNNIVPSKSWSWKIFLQVLHLKALFVMGLKSHFLPVCFYLRVLTFYHVFLFKFQN